jgi:hypothetical protein
VLYTAGIVQLRNDTAGRAYYRRKLAAGKTSMEAMRCLRRRLPDAVYRQLAADARSQEEASPGGHPGASLISSAAGLSPDTGTSDQPLPGPAHPTLPPPPSKTPQPMAPAAAATRRRARGDGVERREPDEDVGPRARSSQCLLSTGCSNGGIWTRPGLASHDLGDRLYRKWAKGPRLGQVSTREPENPDDY